MPPEPSGTIQRIRERLEAESGRTLEQIYEATHSKAPDPEAAWINLDRWLSASGSMWANLNLLLDHPDSGKFMRALGASQPFADALIQNPGLAGLLLDSASPTPPTFEVIFAEGKRMLAAANSHRHGMDQQRYLRQRWSVPIFYSDINSLWEPPVVWRALSDLADALIQLAADWEWRRFATERGLEGEMPILIVGFGKLGGQELNYSSDVDLAYVALDESAERFLEREGPRFCEAMGISLSEKMGRGALFRVDLRLRPYGGSGPILNTARAVESYYQLYAEPWECMALIRSRPIAGPEALWERWEKLRGQYGFPASLSSFALDGITEIWQRTAMGASEYDVKRAPGGIRDVEFTVQTLQLEHGRKIPSLRVRSTLEALDTCAQQGLLPAEAVSRLSSAYVFLRQLEHRCQSAADAQTHEVPMDPEARRLLARALGFEDWNGALAHWTAVRDAVLGETSRIGQNVPCGADMIAWLNEQLPEHQGDVKVWFQSLDPSDNLLRALWQSPSALDRLRKVLSEGAALLPILRKSLPLTESLLSGEVEEPLGGATAIAQLDVRTSVNHLATTVESVCARAQLRWLLHANFDLGEYLSACADAFLQHLKQRLYLDFDLIALGSYARRELSVGSDLDVLLLAPDDLDHAGLEEQAQNLLALADKLKRHGCPFALDLRLRPEGGRGLLVRTYQGLRNYDLDDMEMWERFALGWCRLIFGRDQALALVHKVAYAQPLTPERLSELLKMKKRIETERLTVQHRTRDVKLGWGGLGDLEWFVHLLEMRYPTATRPTASASMLVRIHSLNRASLINAVEHEELVTGRKHLLELRNRLCLMGITNNVCPENPMKLKLLGLAFDIPDANEFLLWHERITNTVRTIFVDTMKELKA